MAQALPVGNAVRLWLTPPAGAVTWRVLRAAAPREIVAFDMKGPAVVADNCDEESVLDATGISNGTAYNYRVFYRDAAGAWTAGNTVLAYPRQSYTPGGPDVQGIIHGRLSAGLAAEIERKTLLLTRPEVQVVMAPDLQVEVTGLPAVSVHFEGKSPDSHALGTNVVTQAQGIGGGDWEETGGTLDRVTIGISAVSLNSEERKQLRQAVDRVLRANQPVFAAAGMLNVQWQQTDREEFTEKGVPVLFTDTSLSCVAGYFVTDTLPPITDTKVTVAGFDNPLTYRTEMIRNV
ncbi:MAG: hypothetical protein E7K72_25025 [Roseomonas mucosa]|nr:hypothetical protein [Roseomonas mucosa]